MASICDVNEKSKHREILDLLSTCQTVKKEAALGKVTEGKSKQFHYRPGGGQRVPGS